MRSIENTHALHVQHVELLNVKADLMTYSDYIPYTILIVFISDTVCA
jgi:hypothetical protein